MAGLDTRFQDSYPNIPKPLIPVGKDRWPMFYLAYTSVDFGRYESDFHFVILKGIMDSKLDGYCYIPHTIHILSEPTSGQAETAYYAIEKLDDDDPILIFNCDSEINWGGGFSNLIQIFKIADGVIPWFYTEEKSKFSFISLDEKSYITNIKEKVAISNYASTGPYIFKNAEIYIHYYNKVFGIDKDFKGERYISRIYEEMIIDRKKILGIPVYKLGYFGTPEDLQKYNEGFRYYGIIPKDGNFRNTHKM